MGFDLSSLDAAVAKQEDGIRVEIKHPATGEPLGMIFTVASYDSERVKAVARSLGNKVLVSQKRNPRRTDTVEAMEDRTFAIAVAAVVGWEGVDLDGKALPCTPDNVRMVLERYPAIAEQVDAAASDRAAFFQS